MRSTPVARLSHSGIGVGGFYGMHMLGIALPLSAGLLLFGWRATIVVSVVLVSALCAAAVWRRIGARGQPLRLSQAAWLAVLLALMLPAHLASAGRDATGEATWLILPAAGICLAIFMWLFGGLGAGRISPPIVTLLLLAALFGDRLTPQNVLRRDRLFVGDLLKADTSEPRSDRRDSWLTRPRGGDGDAERSVPASYELIQYTTGRERPARGWLPIQGLLRDNLPPLEDLIIGGQPGPIGVASKISVIVGGLFLLYRGLIDIRIPMTILLVEFAALLILPVPTAIADQPLWRWLALRDPNVGAATAITLANYEIMASPVLFMAFFLATSPAARPMSRRARWVYGAVIGATSAAAQLYVSVDFGPYVAMLIASLLAPSLDWLFRPQPLM